MTEDIKITRDGALVELRLNRPDKLNALTGAMYDAIASEFVRAGADSTVRAILFSAEGPTFSSGNDIGEFMRHSGDLASSPQARFLSALTDCSKPIVAAVQGAAVGIGTTMLLHCDLVYASEDATLSAPFVSMGLVPEAGSSMMMPELLGFQRAAKLLLLGESLSASQACDAGLVTEVVPVGALYGHAGKKAKRLAAQPPEALAATRALMRGDRNALDSHMRREMAAFERALRGSEAQQAFAAFLARHATHVGRV